MITIGTVLIALLLFTAGGIVKGLLGVGLPMVAIPGLTLIVGLPNALAMVSVPVALANLWQVWQFRQAPGPGGVLVPYLISGAIGTIIGTLILVSLPEAWLELGLATMLIGYVVAEALQSRPEAHAGRRPQKCRARGLRRRRASWLDRDRRPDRQSPTFTPRV